MNLRSGLTLPMTQYGRIATLLPKLFHRATRKTLQKQCRAITSSSSPSSSSSTLSSATASFEPFLNGDASPYMQHMYESWLKDPSSVHVSWSAYFDSLSRGIPPDRAFSMPPRLPAGGPSYAVGSNGAALTGLAGAYPAVHVGIYSSEFSSSDSQTQSQSAYDTSRIIQLVRGYQSRGHEYARIDPLGLPHKVPFVTKARLDARTLSISYKAYGFTEADLDKHFDCRVQGESGFLAVDRAPILLRDLVARLEETYCGSIGIETTHIEDPSVINYLRQRLEPPQAFRFPPDMRLRILNRTARAQLFETFCGTKFSTAKRFGVDGSECAVVIMKAITKKSVMEGVNSIVIGMPHRGRLNMLTNVLHKPMQQMMLEFQGITGFGGTDWGNTGDVKYHLGVECDHFDEDANRSIHMSVLANPSHLEAVDPLVVGQVRAQQYYSNDKDRTKVIPIILHGDASFAGQGVVYETMQMSQLQYHTVGGTIHVIVNNQIGFTTNVADQGSGRYCSDLAKSIDAPVFHVNADDPEACTFVAHLALDFRQKFHRDVCINLWGYRRFGHNELDMPKFTQPIMYNLIARHPKVFEIYSQKLIAESLIDAAYVEKLTAETLAFYNDQYEKSKNLSAAATTPTPHEYSPQWKHMARPGQVCPPRVSGVDLKRLKTIGKEIATLPETLSPHPTIGKTYKAREEVIESGENLDIGFAEALAFATLLSDGFHVRVSGQDVQRGTFSHRHAVVHDQTVARSYCPLQEFVKNRQLPHKFEAGNSPLSEFAVLGFEVGYALEHPDTLAIWEAQFGDFANGAQIIIDQFIAAGETKWGTQCGIVMLLPHGYDGQGPEHSSARIERFLQLCDDREDIIQPEFWDVSKRSVIQQHNFQVVNCTTPANYFHVLRRQMHRGFRKPLVIISAKRMLKMRATFSRLIELAESTCFLRYIPNISTQESQRPDFIGVERLLPVDESIERLVLCSGQVYYDLAAYREKHRLWNVALARVEQLSPFPFDRVIDDIQRYPNVRNVVWAQEEPMNAGPWLYTSKRISLCLEHLGRPNGISYPLYVGRDVSAAPAVGDARLHQQELERILTDAFCIYRSVNSYYEKYIPDALLAASQITAGGIIGGSNRPSVSSEINPAATKAAAAKRAGAAGASGTTAS